jgi:hypothetical protein
MPGAAPTVGAASAPATPGPTPTSGKREGFWAILNSSFTLWLLSTLLVGLGGWSFQQYQEHRRKENERETRRRKIATEIEDRISQSDMEPLPINSVLNRLDGNGAYATDKEFQHRPLTSLLLELKSLCNSEQSKDHLESLIFAHKSLPRSAKDGDPDASRAFRSFVQRARTLIQPFLT